MTDLESKLNKIGKELPYAVPTDFFEGLPQKTLLLAKERQERRRRSKRMLRLVTLFSSAAAVLLLVLIVPPATHRDDRRAENIETVLQDLSEDDLTQMTVVYGSDLMDEELTQENSY